MNTLLKKITTGLGITLSLGLASCKENSLVLPDNPVVDASTLTKGTDDLSPIYAQTQTLISWGGINLYYKEGRLDEMKNYNDIVGTYRIGFVYTRLGRDVNSLSITATLTALYFPDHIYHKTTYLVDGAGHCYETTDIAYSYPTGTTTAVASAPQTWGYVYNTNGQLSFRFNKKTVERFTYEYDTADDLTTVTSYGISGQAVKLVTFDYAQPTGKPLINRGSIHSELIDLPNSYLPVFGKYSKHLVRRAIQTKLPGNQVQLDRLHDYILDTHGYVIRDTELTTSTNTMFCLNTLTYLITNPSTTNQ